MRSSWPSRVLLPAAQVLAEGSWLAVAYAAAQAVVGQAAWIGPIELGVLAWAGMAWGRRRRLRSPSAEALGLPILALLAGMAGWLLDPQVRQALVQGQPLVALGLHGPGWLAGIAFWRGEMHRSPEDDDAIQDRLLRWAVPGLAIPWAIGHLAAEGAVEQDFVAAAFVGTVFFVASAFIAMGLARLEAVRATTGSDWRGNRSWLGLVVLVALGVTVVSVPAAALLDVPARSLMVALLGPIQTILLILLVIATPVIVVAAAIADLIAPLLPAGIDLGQISLPDLGANGHQVVSSLPVVVFYVVIGLLVLVELLVVAAIIWVRWQERRRMRIVIPDAFEERSIVIPADRAPTGPRPRLAARRRRATDDPTGAYLQALDALARDGRWPRHAEETPAAHATRVRADGLDLPALARLAAGYQLVHYAGRALGTPERQRAPQRLAALRRFLR
jgi:hypothetical protein